MKFFKKFPPKSSVNEKSISVNKKIIKFPDRSLSYDGDGGKEIPDLISAFIAQGTPRVKDREIVIGKSKLTSELDFRVIEYNREWRDLNLKGLKNDENLSRIAEEEVSKIAQEILEMLRDPIRFAGHLKDLEEDLEKAAKAMGIESDLTPSYHDTKYLIATNARFLLGPPSNPSYKKVEKSYLLDQLLLRREQEHGINMDGVTRFVGYVAGKHSNNLLKDGDKTFADDSNIHNVLLHGSQTHRIQLEAIRQFTSEKIEKEVFGAEEPNRLYVESLSRNLTQRELLKILNNVKVTDSMPVESNQKPAVRPLSFVLMDIQIDCYARKNLLGQVVIRQEEELFKVKNYSYSSRDPDVCNSLLLCFGDELGLPRICSYLRSSFWSKINTISSKTEISLTRVKSIFLKVRKQSIV